MMLRVEQGKGRKDRYAMLSPHAARAVCATGIALRGRRAGYFPGTNPVNPMTTRQLSARLPRRSPHGRDRQAGDATHLAS